MQPVLRRWLRQGDIPSRRAARARPSGWLHCGPSDRVTVKMVHNGIEYGLMQAYGEGSTS